MQLADIMNDCDGGDDADDDGNVNVPETDISG